MTTLFVFGCAMVAMLVLTGLAVAWAALRAVLWLVFLPLILLKAAFGLVFGLLFGAFGLIVGLVVTVVLGGLGVLAVLAVLAIPAIPLLLLGAIVWLAVKGTTALAAA
jgi:hypothetical protein